MVMDQSAPINHRLRSGQSKAAFLADVFNKTSNPAQIGATSGH